jgi:hypothetical protein
MDYLHEQTSSASQNETPVVASYSVVWKAKNKVGEGFDLFRLKNNNKPLQKHSRNCLSSDVSYDPYIERRKNRIFRSKSAIFKTLAVGLDQLRLNLGRSSTGVSSIKTALNYLGRPRLSGFYMKHGCITSVDQGIDWAILSTLDIIHKLEFSCFGSTFVQT